MQIIIGDLTTQKKMLRILFDRAKFQSQAWLIIAVADPGFPRGGGANSPGGGEAPTYDFAKFSQKLHEIERIWAPKGRARPSRPLRSAIA